MSRCVCVVFASCLAGRAAPSRCASASYLRKRWNVRAAQGRACATFVCRECRVVSASCLRRVWQVAQHRSRYTLRALQDMPRFCAHLRRICERAGTFVRRRDAPALPLSVGRSRCVCVMFARHPRRTSERVRTSLFMRQLFFKKEWPVGDNMGRLIRIYKKQHLYKLLEMTRKPNRPSESAMALHKQRTNKPNGK